MRILIAGADTPLGKETTKYFDKRYEVYPFSATELDVTSNESVESAMEAVDPTAVINCSVMTDVFECNSDEEKSFRMNAFAPGLLALAAARRGAIFISYSSVYVYGGKKPGYYSEKDIPEPETVCGRSFLEGEKLIVSACPKHFILRLPFFYSHFAPSFVSFIAESEKREKETRVLNDSYLSPTSGYEIVRMTDAVLDDGEYGIYNLSCRGSTSWSNFAKEICRLYGVKKEISDAQGDGFQPTPMMPKNLSLSSALLTADTGYTPPEWKDALAKFINEDISRAKAMESETL